MRKKSLSWALCGVFALALAAQAGVISVNFTESAGHANQQLEPDTSAGVWPRANWNNTTDGANGTVNGLVDSTGVTNAGVSITWSTGGGWGDGWANADATAGIGDAQVTRGYLDDNGPVAISVSGIPYANYSVAVLYSTDQGDPLQFGSATFNGTEVYTPEGIGRRYTNDPQQWNTNTTVVATNLTLSTLQIDMAARNGNSRAAVAGIQIVESTEGAHPPFPLPPEPEGPVWVSDPFDGPPGYVGAVFYAELSAYCSDINGDPITYTLDSGPAWISISTNGYLVGTPTGTDLGLNTVDLTATAVDGTNSATMNIQVTPLVLGEQPAISVNFYGWWDPIDQLAPGTSAGLEGYVYTNWNNVTAEVGGQGSLVDSEGTITGASVTWDASWLWGDWTAEFPATEGVGDAEMAVSYLDDGNDPGTGVDWQLTGIPYDNYTLVIYLSTDTPDGTYKPFVINGVTSAPTIPSKSQYKTPNWDETNTLVFEDLSGDLDVQGFGRYEYLTGDERASVAGFQVINGYVVGDPVTDLMITGPVSAGTQMILTWTGEDGRLYGVETNSNLIVGNWQTFETGLVGDGGTMTVTNDIGPDQTFYQVISE